MQLFDSVCGAALCSKGEASTRVPSLRQQQACPHARGSRVSSCHNFDQLLMMWCEFGRCLPDETRKEYESRVEYVRLAVAFKRTTKRDQQSTAAVARLPLSIEIETLAPRTMLLALHGPFLGRPQQKCFFLSSRGKRRLQQDDSSAVPIRWRKYAAYLVHNCRAAPAKTIINPQSTTSTSYLVQLIFFCLPSDK